MTVIDIFRLGLALFALGFSAWVAIRQHRLLRAEKERRL